MGDSNSTIITLIPHVDGTYKNNDQALEVAHFNNDVYMSSSM